MLTKDQKAYIEANYMTASDTVIAKQLGVKPHAVRDYRESRRLIKYIERKYGYKDTLCWTCRLAGMSCRKPVDGWVAAYAPVACGKEMVDSWIVTSCPAYAPDRRAEKRLQSL